MEFCFWVLQYGYSVCFVVGVHISISSMQIIYIRALRK